MHPLDDGSRVHVEWGAQVAMRMGKLGIVLCADQSWSSNMLCTESAAAADETASF